GITARQPGSSSRLKMTPPVPLRASQGFILETTRSSRQGKKSARRKLRRRLWSLTGWKDGPGERRTMTSPPLPPALRHVPQLLARPDAGGVSDAQLLQRFVNSHDETAFELLVWRHGPMALGVCRRILRDTHDAEDAFQATLLVLAHKAHSIGKG